METVPIEGTGMFPELNRGAQPRQQTASELEAEAARRAKDDGRAQRHVERCHRDLQRLGEKISPDTPTDPQVFAAFKRAQNRLQAAEQALHVIEEGRPSANLLPLWPSRRRSSMISRPRTRGAGRPACSRHARRSASSSTSSGTDPGRGEDGPAPPHRRRSQHRRRRSC